MSETGDKVRRISKIIETNMKKRHFNNELGLELEDFDDEYGAVPIASFLYEMKEHHLNNYDSIHGGIVASIFDVAMGIGSAALSNSMVTTTDMSFTFLRPARGKKFRVIVEYGRVGQNIVNCTAKLFALAEKLDEEDVLCSTAMGNYFILGIPIERAGEISK